MGPFKMGDAKHLVAIGLMSHTAVPQVDGGPFLGCRVVAIIFNTPGSPNHSIVSAIIWRVVALHVGGLDAIVQLHQQHGVVLDINERT